MHTQCSAPALLDGSHHLESTQTQMVAMGVSPSWPMDVDDVCSLQGSGAMVGLPRDQLIQWACYLTQHVGGRLGCHVRGAVELTRCQRLHWVKPGKAPPQSSILP